MSKIKNHYNCSLHLAVDLIGGKWKARILWHIFNGENRFSTLLKAIPTITHKMLTTQLRELEEHKIIIKKVFDEKPLKIKYYISEKYLFLKYLLDDFCNFAKIYSKENNITITD